MLFYVFFICKSMFFNIYVLNIVTLKAAKLNSQHVNEWSRHPQTAIITGAKTWTKRQK